MRMQSCRLPRHTISDSIAQPQPIDSQLPTVLFRNMNSCDGPQAYEGNGGTESTKRAMRRTSGHEAGIAEFIQSP